MQRLLFGAGVAAIGLASSLDFASEREPTTIMQRADAAAPLVWAVDMDGDGVTDLANPTRGLVRGVDAYGSGRFGARRDRGKRLHEGADFIAAAGSEVASPLGGVVSDIGYAYDGDEKLRFIEIKDASLGMKARVFYVDPAVTVGDSVKAGDAIGAAEDLALRYPGGMTNHIHLELRDSHGAMLDPEQVLPLGAAPVTRLAALAEPAAAR